LRAARIGALVGLAVAIGVILTGAVGGSVNEPVPMIASTPSPAPTPSR
jgi:hypothetical protein